VRIALATLSFMPYVVLFQEPEGSSEMGLVEAMRPHDYSAQAWRFVVEHHARRLFNSAAFDEVFTEARAQIEQQDRG
jgi:hypothetical protein